MIERAGEFDTLGPDHSNTHRRREVMSGAPPVIAKMDAYQAQTVVPSGPYRLIPVPGPGIAKMDAYLVEMRVLSNA